MAVCHSSSCSEWSGCVVFYNSWVIAFISTKQQPLNIQFLAFSVQCTRSNFPAPGCPPLISRALSTPTLMNSQLHLLQIGFPLLNQGAVRGFQVPTLRSLCSPRLVCRPFFPCVLIKIYCHLTSYFCALISSAISFKAVLQSQNVLIFVQTRILCENGTSCHAAVTLEQKMVAKHFE